MSGVLGQARWDGILRFIKLLIDTCEIKICGILRTWPNILDGHCKQCRDGSREQTSLQFLRYTKRIGGSAKTHEGEHTIGVTLPTLRHRMVFLPGLSEVHREQRFRTIGKVGLSREGLTLLVIYRGENMEVRTQRSLYMNDSPYLDPALRCHEALVQTLVEGETVGNR